jgi:hypothetical protein
MELNTPYLAGAGVLVASYRARLELRRVGRFGYPAQGLEIWLERKQRVQIDAGKGEPSNITESSCPVAEVGSDKQLPTTIEVVAGMIHGRIDTNVTYCSWKVLTRFRYDGIMLMP